MAMIIDATAKYGIRGAIRSLLSPQSTSSDGNEDLLRNTYAHARDTKAEERDEYVFIGSAMNVQTVADAKSGYTPM
ncbi:hypothetical protein IG631_08920 [Alternaria alternata]|nr:hypothetical protein IG631_08920 [Alternaria alternata]